VRERDRPLRRGDGGRPPAGLVDDYAEGSLVSILVEVPASPKVRAAAFHAPASSADVKSLGGGIHRVSRR
jgi:hypothetical protein